MSKAMNNITVNNQSLKEYLKDKEKIKDEVRRDTLFREESGLIKLRKHVKAKYEPIKGKNGRVKKLGKHEINMANYKKYLLEAVKKWNVLEIIVIILLANPTGKKRLSLHDIVKIVEDFFSKNNIAKKKNISHSFRGKLGDLKKSKLAEHINFFDRNTYENPESSTKYEFKDLNSLSIKDALNLSKDYNPKLKLETTRDSINLPGKKYDNNLIEGVIKQIKSIKDDTDSAVFIIKGDLHIHINLK